MTMPQVLAILAMGNIAMHCPAIDCDGMTMNRVLSCEYAEALV